MNRIRLFLIISLSCSLSFLLYNLSGSGTFFNHVILGPDAQFNDFFFYFNVASDGDIVYHAPGGSAMPPFAYILYWFFWRTAGAFRPESSADYNSFMLADNALTVFMLYNLMLIVLLFVCISLYLPKAGRGQMAATMVAIILSYPFLATSLQRGNTVVLVSMMIAIAYAWNKSDSELKREGALLLIAAAAGIKIYPAICGIQLIKDKEYKRGVRLVIYGLLFFFVPFLLFGGLDGLKALVNMYLSMEENRVEIISAKGMVAYLFRVILKRGGENAQAVFGVVAILFCVVLAVCFFLAKTQWQEQLCLSGLMIAAVVSNNVYCSVYLLSPFLLWMSGKEETDSGKWVQNITTILFSLVFTLPWFLSSLPRGDSGRGIDAGISLLIYILLFWQMIRIIARRSRDAKKSR